jgi:Mg-chelatase subunit ChlD
LDPKGEEEALSSAFGREFVEDLLYSMFNPDRFPEDGNQIDQLMEEQMSKWQEQMQDFMEEKFGTAKQSWIYKDWLEERAKREFIRKNAWEQLLESVKKGEISVDSLPVRKISQTFTSEVVKGLEQEGYLEVRNVWDSQRAGYTLGWVDFTSAGEGVIAKKVLDEVLNNLEFPSIELGEDLQGFGTQQSNTLSDFDEMQHSYDLIDLYETAVDASLKKSRTLFEPDDVKVRLPISRFSSTNVILIDSSNSMYGPKFKGALMAALALKRLLEEHFKDDELYIVAYDDEPTLLHEGEILRLRPQGNTDIGSAIDFARKLLRNCEGNRNVFLITDGEPTSSSFEDASPEESAYRAAYQTGLEEININIILLDQKPELKAIAEGMARLNTRSTVTFVNDPLRLKDFVVKNYVLAKGLRVRQLKKMRE